MSNREQFLATKTLGTAVASDDLAALIAAKGSTGNATPLLLDGSGNLKVNVAVGGGGGDATAANQATGNASLASILAKISADPATQTTLAAVLAKLTADPATQTTLAAVLAKLSADPATQTTLAAILAKLSSDPATQTTLAAILTAVQAATPPGSALIGKVGIDQTTPGTTNRVSTAPQGASVQATLTRTADANAYAANDVLGAATGATAALTFTNAGPSGGGLVRVLRATLMIESSALISGEGSYDLHLYSVTPPSVIGDNAAFDLPTGDRASYLGKITIGTPADLGSTLVAEADQVNKDLLLASANVFGYLVTSGAYTPASARVYRIALQTVTL